MSSKTDTEVIIGGKVFTLSGYESEEYLQNVALYINGKIADFKGNDAYKKMSADFQRTLLNLNIADDYFKAKKTADKLQVEMEAKDKQLYDLKHDLVAANLKLESYEKEIARLKKKESKK